MPWLEQPGQMCELQGTGRNAQGLGPEGRVLSLLEADHLWPGAQWPSPLLASLSSCRVKSEAIIARREPKEEGEDVSSYLCTELVYSTINMWGRGVAVGGLPGMRSSLGASGPPHPHPTCVMTTPSSILPTPGCHNVRIGPLSF